MNNPKEPTDHNLSPAEPTIAKARRKEAVGIRKSLDNAQKYILKRENQSRWVWNYMHKRCHDNQFRVLALLNSAEDELEASEKRSKWPDGFVEEILDLLDLIEMEDDASLSRQRLRIAEKHGLTVEICEQVSGAIN